MEMTNEKNFLNVITIVTVSEVYSDANLNTLLTQIYWVNMFTIKYNHNRGTSRENMISEIEVAGDWLNIKIFSYIFLQNIRKNGIGSVCYWVNSLIVFELIALKLLTQ